MPWRESSRVPSIAKCRLSPKKLSPAGLRARAKDLCRLARSSYQDALLPITEGTDQFGTFVDSIVLSARQLPSPRIELWTRTTWYRSEQLRDSLGIPLVADGIQLTQRRPTGQYRLDRRIFDCGARSIATVETASYSPEQPEPTVSRTRDTDARADSVLPGSVGEAMLIAACAVYGQR